MVVLLVVVIAAGGAIMGSFDDELEDEDELELLWLLAVVVSVSSGSLAIVGDMVSSFIVEKAVLVALVGCTLVKVGFGELEDELEGLSIV